MGYNLRKKKKLDDKSKKNDDSNDNKEVSNDDDDELSSSSSDNDSVSIDSDELTDIDDNCDDDDTTSHNLDILNEFSLKRKLTKSILVNIKKELDECKKININKYLSDLENKINLSELNKDDNKNNIIISSSIELSNSILKNLINEIRFEYKFNKKLDLKGYIDNKLSLLDEIENLDGNDNYTLPASRGNASNIIFQLMIDPMKYLKNEDYEDYEGYDEYDDKDYNPLKEENLNKYDKEFNTFLKDGINNKNRNEMDYFKNLSDKEKKKLLGLIDNIKEDQTNDKPKLLKIVDSDTSFNNKSVIINKFLNFDSLPPFSGEYFKLKNWVDAVSQIPFGVFKKPKITYDSDKRDIKVYLRNVKNYMDNSVYGHENAKRQILQVIAQTITNPNEGGTILAIHGPPGVGKTQLIQDGISKALDRPFEFIALGGATDSAFLEGFDFTYEGSRWGKIVDCLIKSKCMNPVIFFDELDKVSGTYKGDEIINILTHLTDVTQNSHFNDKYFHGIDFDLSKAIFIFSFNDEWKINKVLKDRMYVIKTDGFELNDKLKISQNYLIPKIIKSVGYPESKIDFSDEILEFIIESYTYEGGVRKLKENILEICKELNLRMLSGTKLLGNKIKFPLKITKKMLTDDIFKKKVIYKPDKINDSPKVGLVNGLWANDMGVGGVLPIEAYLIPTNSKFELELTGQQGDVMKESMKCAKTVAWNVLPDKCKEKLNKEWKNFGYSGIHIHCPDGSTPKDGPSAGAAITTVILSLLMNEPINNEVAMTGEINLKGDVTQIGGLKHKLNGAKKAGVKHVLIPYENKKDFDKVIMDDDSLLSSKFKVTMVENIKDVLVHCFKKNINIKRL